MEKSKHFTFTYSVCRRKQLFSHINVCSPAGQRERASAGHDDPPAHASIRAKAFQPTCKFLTSVSFLLPLITCILIVCLSFSCEVTVWHTLWSMNHVFWGIKERSLLENGGSAVLLSAVFLDCVPGEQLNSIVSMQVHTFTCSTHPCTLQK